MCVCVSACNMTDLDCHAAQLGVIAWRQIKARIISQRRPPPLPLASLGPHQSTKRHISIFNGRPSWAQLLSLIYGQILVFRSILASVTLGAAGDPVTQAVAN